MVWRSEADFEAHQNAPHCKEFHEKAGDLVESVVETKFKQVLR